MSREVMAYTYDADYHCIECTKTQFPPSLNKDGNANDIPSYASDREGNMVQEVYDTDEWQEFDESFLADNPVQYLVCGDCHVIIDSYLSMRLTTLYTTVREG